HPGVRAVLAGPLGVAVGAEDPDLVADAVIVKGFAGRLELGLVVLGAHDDPDQGRIDLDLLERLLDLGHGLDNIALGHQVLLTRHRSGCVDYAAAASSPSALAAMSVRSCRPSKLISSTASYARRRASPAVGPIPVTLRTRPPAVTTSPSLRAVP